MKFMFHLTTFICINLILNINQTSWDVRILNTIKNIFSI